MSGNAYFSFLFVTYVKHEDRTWLYSTQQDCYHYWSLQQIQHNLTHMEIPAGLRLERFNGHNNLFRDVVYLSHKLYFWQHWQRLMVVMRSIYYMLPYMWDRREIGVDTETVM